MQKGDTLNTSDFKIFPLGYNGEYGTEKKDKNTIITGQKTRISYKLTCFLYNNWKAS